MMDSKFSRSRVLTIKDFKEDDIGKFRFAGNDHEVVFYEDGAEGSKMKIEVWYLEEQKRYKKDERVIDRKFTNNKYLIKERNRQIWYWINRFYKAYCSDIKST